MIIVNFIVVDVNHIVAATDNGYLLFWKLTYEERKDELPSLVGCRKCERIDTNLLGLDSSTKTIIAYLS